MSRINPLSDLRRDLVSVLNPVRYLGGEYGQIVKDHADLTFALAFPDLYEIAMSNLAIKVIYDGLNRLPSVRCERVFAPAPDFEELLARKQIPLYTLESGIPLREVDVLGVSLGYEPGITGLLSILESGGIPLDCSSRGKSDPIVLAGGCGITNPAPFSRFIDAFFIGEAEAGLFELVEDLGRMKRAGASRDDLLARLESHPAVWTESKDRGRVAREPCARRAVWSGFGDPDYRAVCFPVPNMRIVQDHGAVEIMRGCPNGCRFCHAGIYYRPQRMKGVDRIIADVDYLVNSGGYREISLMSLSSGDYAGIDCLLDTLSARYAGRNVSFQLPSLKVNSFTLPLLERMAEVRKSGLTFAVETPVDAWQLSLNKEVYRDRIVEIVNEAKRHGWSKAKFYFMIGLPIERGGQREEEEIVKFLLEIQERTRIQCTANIGTFIPKPHTPYQWSHQLSMEEANRKLDFIHGSLPRGRFKVSTHRPLNSFLEGMMSRGDRRVGDIILEAFRRGCRLDAWEDWAKPEIWKAVIAESAWNVEEATIRERPFDEALPWDGVSLGVGKAWLKKEMERSDKQMLTERCHDDCADPCGVCGSKVSVVELPPPASESGTAGAESAKPEQPDAQARAEPVKAPEAAFRVLVSFEKRGEAAFIPHLGLLEVWHKAFQRSRMPVIFTEGFNPLPRFEIAQSLSLGIYSDEEIASFMLAEEVSADEIRRLLLEFLPSGIRVSRVFAYPLSRKTKREPLSKYLWGSTYRYSFYEASVLDAVLADSRFTAFVDANAGAGLSLARLPVNAAGSAGGEGDDLGEDCMVELALPFSLDRPIRDLIAEIVGKPAHEVMGIRKTRMHAVKSAGGTENFFSAFERIAEVNQKLLASETAQA